MVIVAAVPLRRGGVVVPEEFEAVAMQAAVEGGLKAEVVPTVNVEKRGGEGAGGFELVGVGGTVECLAAKVFGLGTEL